MNGRRLIQNGESLSVSVLMVRGQKMGPVGAFTAYPLFVDLIS